MTWARLDDSFWRNPKVVGCSDAALGLYVRAIAYCADQRTDGELSGTALKMLRAKVARLKELVAAGLLDDACNGYVVHDFLEYNPSRADLQKKVIAGQAGGQASAQARAQANGQAVPSRPVPSRSRPKDHPPDPPQAGGTSPAALRALEGSNRKRDVAAATAELSLEQRYLGRHR